MKQISLNIALALLIFPSILLAQTRPSENVSIGTVRELNLPGCNYLCVDTQATLRTMGETAKIEIPKLIAALKSADIQPRGPLVFIVEGLDADPGAEFDLKIGIAVDDGAVAPEGYEVDPLPPVECQTVLFGGPVTQMRLAFQKLMPKVRGGNAGTASSGEIREYFLYFENANSPNDVTLIAAVLQ